MITNLDSGTNVHEIASGIYRINTPVRLPDGLGFNFNQYLIDDEAPLLFHTGPRRMFPLVQEAVARLIPIDRLRYVGFSHFEADECGALNEWLAAAPRAEPLCGRIGAMVSVNDVADRPARALADGETLALGRRTMRWFDTPHMPHGWDCGLMMEMSTRTFLCGDLFTQGGPGETPLTESDILGAERSVPSADGLLRTFARRAGRFSNVWRSSDPRRWRACTAARTAAMARRCCVDWGSGWPKQRAAFA